MSKELETKKQKNVILAEHAAMAEEVFGDLTIDSSDILIPKLLLMQASSEAVAAEKARIGDFINSVSGEKIGSIVEPIEIIPFYNTKCIDIINADDSNKLLRKEPFTPETAALPWEDTENGVKIKRFTRLDFFCLLPSQIAKGAILPFVVSFRSTSYKTGQAILTQWMEIRERNRIAQAEGRLNDIQMPFSKSFLLEGKKITNEKKQTYAVPSVRVHQDVSEEEQRMCLQWIKTVKANKTRVDDSDEMEATAQASTGNMGAEPADTGRF